MPKKDNKKKYKLVLIALAIVIVVLLIGALVGKRASEQKDLAALNEAISNSLAVQSGSATGYSMGYLEGSSNIQQTDRKTVFYKQENAYTFYEISSDKASGNVLTQLYVKDDQYFQNTGDGWGMTAIDTASQNYTPYGIYRMITPVSSAQISSIRKQEGERPGYKVTFTRQWITQSYQGKDTPLSSEAYYEVKEVDGKPIVVALEQTFRSRKKTDKGNFVSVFEEKAFLRANETEDGKAPKDEVERFFKEEIDGKWSPAIDLSSVDTSNAEIIEGTGEGAKDESAKDESASGKKEE